MKKNGLKHIIIFDKSEARLDVIASFTDDSGDELQDIKGLLLQDAELSKIVARMSISLTQSFDAYEYDYCPNSFLKAWPNPGEAEWLR